MQAATPQKSSPAADVEEGTHCWVKRQSEGSSSSRNANAVQSRQPSSVKQRSSFSDSESEVSSSAGRSLSSSKSWGWNRGILCGTSTKGISVKLGDEVILLPSSAFDNGLIVMDNEYPTDEQGNIACPNDLITLTHLHEPAVVFSLEQRYKQDYIYTATGPVLLALNPFKPIRHLYGEVTMKKYWDTSNKSDLPPHVYQIADAAFRDMMRSLEDHQPKNQAILVSGESGAGKTVTTKFVMKYLAALSQRAATPSAPVKRAYLQVQEKQREQSQSQTQTQKWNNANGPTKPSSILQFGANSIESKVLQSNPILESFGNARTIRNDNSSRFGKFIELQFTSSGKLVGATIETYLLEKVRLISQSLGERNYHVFYEILGGMEKRELRQYYLAPTAGPDDFCLLNSSGTYDRRDRVSDQETYKALKQAMNTMKFSPAQQKDIFSVAAALLHASNLTFQELKNEQSQLDFDNVHLAPVCHLLGVTPQEFNQALCTFSIQAGRDGSVRKTLSRSKSEKGLEALIKATYGAMFDYLVVRINDSIAYQSEEEPPVATIGVLDIFGFESFQVNSFEQLCINYCNEALQQQFNAFVLKNEQEEYEREGIEWSFIEFPENQDVLDLINKRGQGILNILDDHCRAPGATDRSFAADIFNKCTPHSRFQSSRKQTAALQFEVNHYAGPVEYTIQGFVQKNRDELPKESTELLSHSSNPFVAFLSEILTGLKDIPVTSDDLKPKQLRRTESSLKKTVGGQFREQLKDLRSKIDKTSPHYVRCLKPNDMLVPDHFDELIVAEQLSCGGILEAVRVSRAGFPQHYPHQDFWRRYKCVATKELTSKPSSSTSPFCPTYGSPAKIKKWEPPRSGVYRSSYSPSSQAGRGSSQQQPKEVNYKDSCKDLLKVIYRKIQAYNAEENKENGSVKVETPKAKEQPAAKAKSYSSPSTSTPPSWSKAKIASPPKTAPVKSRYQPWTKPASPSTPAPVSTYRRRGGMDGTKMGIQMGKTKVFLRHRAFEVLERIRSKSINSSATKLNSLFRMYLSRMAYVPVRDAYRMELRELGIVTTPSSNGGSVTRSPRPDPIRRADSKNASLLISKFESDVRNMIHSPMAAMIGDVSPKKLFKWVLVDGIWVKNSQSP